jgi:hypothetical protein
MPPVGQEGPARGDPGIRFLTPVRPDELVVKPIESAEGRVRFTVPEFLVYGVARIE